MGSVIGEGQTEASSVSPVSSPRLKKKKNSDIFQFSQVGQGPKRAVQLGIWLEKQADSDKASLLRRAKHLGHENKTKQNKMLAVLSYLLETRETEKGLKIGC